MRMKTPSHPGAIVKDSVEYLGLSVAEAARGLGITRQQLYRIIRSESGISPDVALRLEQAVGSTADHWLRMQASYDLARARQNPPVIKKFEPKAA
ncbi:MAG: HigA family addiction module antitoxin [Devosia sp.]|nr:HigA family addiction module antitoxin [Devosia sp.]